MKRKRLIIVLLLLICLTGCAFGSSPKSRVENLLNKYQMNSSDIKSELDDFLNTLSIDTDYKEDYRKVYEKQYSDLKYKIKDEKIDGDKATVTAEIEVYDYYKAENDASSYIAANPNEFNEDGVYSVKKGLEYKIKAYNNTKDRVTYTIDFTLTKTDNKWTIDPLTDDELAKLHGTYAH